MKRLNCLVQAWGVVRIRKLRHLVHEWYIRFGIQGRGMTHWLCTISFWAKGLERLNGRVLEMFQHKEGEPTRVLAGIFYKPPLAAFFFDLQFSALGEDESDLQCVKLTCIS